MIGELTYVGLGSPRHTAWRSYGADVLGARIAPDGPDGAVRLAIDDVHHRLAIHPAERDEFRYAGWSVRDAAALRDAERALRARGVAVERGDAALAAEREVAEIVWFEDPWGLRHELSWGKAATPLSFVPGRPMRGRFVTGALGLGHVVFHVPDLDAAQEFYLDVLGFTLSDRVVVGAIDVRFLRVNGRHHSLALTEMPGHVGINHLMVQVEELDDLGTFLDRVHEHDVPIVQSLGRHTNDLTTSVYVASPSGVYVEYGYGGVEVDDATWIARTYTRPSYWGHRRASAERPHPGIAYPVAMPVVG